MLEEARKVFLTDVHGISTPLSAHTLTAFFFKLQVVKENRLEPDWIPPLALLFFHRHSDFFSKYREVAL